jgi:hypothetical protein
MNLIKEMKYKKFFCNPSSLLLAGFDFVVGFCIFFEAFAGEVS